MFVAADYADLHRFSWGELFFGICADLRNLWTITAGYLAMDMFSGSVKKSLSPSMAVKRFRACDRGIYRAIQTFFASVKK